jgi:hypothetical protein
MKSQCKELLKTYDICDMVMECSSTSSMKPNRAPMDISLWPNGLPCINKVNFNFNFMLLVTTLLPCLLLVVTSCSRCLMYCLINANQFLTLAISISNYGFNTVYKGSIYLNLGCVCTKASNRYPQERSAISVLWKKNSASIIFLWKYNHIRNRKCTITHTATFDTTTY